VADRSDDRHARSATALGNDISLRRLEQVGFALTTTAAVSAELADDYPIHSRIMQVADPPERARHG
jgi:hypothetical protein